MATLATYIQETRDLLHDLSGAFWSDSQLTNYINSARNKTVWATKCIRKLQPFATVAQQEVYDFSALPQNILGKETTDVLNITLVYGSQRYPLSWLAWSGFNAYYRPWTTFYQQPVAFSLYGQSQFYLGPNPDQVYPLELDTVITPAALNLALPNAVDEIIDPYTSPVKYYAAHLAKLYQQQFNDAVTYEKRFDSDVERVMRGVSNRRLASPFPARY